jgi:hypothetical protein
MHMPYVGPNCISIGQSGSLVLVRPDRGVEFVSRTEIKELEAKDAGDAHVYLVPSSIGRRSLIIAWYVNSWINGAIMSMERSVIINVPRGRGGSEGFCRWAQVKERAGNTREGNHTGKS